MKLKIRYEQKYEILEVSSEEMWVSLSLEGGEELTQEEKETLIQDAFEEQFNKPDYNNWHKFDRHRGNLKKQYRKDDEAEDETDAMDTIADNSQETERNSNYEYEDICSKIRQVLIKKPEWADAFIAVRIDGISIREYASSIGVDENNITQKLKRATKKLKDFFENHQI